MKKNSLLFLVFLSLPLYTWADKTLDSLLNVLDRTIQEHETYVAQRELRTSDFFRKLYDKNEFIEKTSMQYYAFPHKTPSNES